MELCQVVVLILFFDDVIAIQLALIGVEEGDGGQFVLFVNLLSLVFAGELLDQRPFLLPRLFHSFDILLIAILCQRYDLLKIAIVWLVNVSLFDFVSVEVSKIFVNVGLLNLLIVFIHIINKCLC